MTDDMLELLYLLNECKDIPASLRERIMREHDGYDGEADAYRRAWIALQILMIVEREWVVVGSMAGILEEARDEHTQ